MLRAERVSFQYSGANEASIVNANISFSESSINLLWGDNGAGKSTLALILCGAIPHLIKGDFSGSVFWDRKLLSESLIPTLSSFVFQNPYTFFQGYTIQDELELIADRSDDLTEAAHALLPRVPFEAPLHTLSLGQQERVAICAAVLRSAPMLFLDEPFESLDDDGVKQATKLIAETAASGRIVSLIQRPQQREFFIECQQGYEVIDGTVREGFPDRPPVLSPIAKPTPGSSNIVLERVSFFYSRSSDFAIKDIGFSIAQGEIVGLIGPNGSGKTTLLLIMAGLLSSMGGSISICNRKVKGKYLRREVKCAFQNPEAQLFGNSAREELEFGLLNSGLNQSEVNERINGIAEQLPFRLTADPFSLSFGQKKILSIVATFLLHPKVILLDEPTAGLDLKNILIFHELAEQFLAAGGSILVSSHNLAEIRALTDRVFIMNDGVLQEEC